MKTMQGRFRAAVLMGAAASVLAFAAGAPAQDHNNGTWPYATTGKSPVLAVVGDISCQPGAAETGEGGTEHANETCTTPKAPYASTSPGPYSLYQSQEATANQIENMKPDAIALLGDLQYQVGLYSDFEGSFDLTYGGFKFLERPSPGNHEFYNEHSATGVAGYGYFDYFNGFQLKSDGSGSIATTTVQTDPCPSGLVWTDPHLPYPTYTAATPCSYPGLTTPALQPIPRADGQAGHFEEPTTENPVGVGDGWYSYNLGSWHLISLNIECSTQQPGGCPAQGADPSPGTWFANELAWLKRDLEENQSACTLAYWHQPTFSATNGISPEGIAAEAFWKLLYDHKADLVLNGHDHLYARYTPLQPDGTPDERGIREFIVGTGGETLDPIVTTPTVGPFTSTNLETNQEDPGGNPNFNAKYLEAYTGDYWGVMKLTLDPNGYKWDFESSLAGPTGLVSTNGPTLPAPNMNGGYSDTGYGSCHNAHDRDRHDDDHDQ